MGSRGTCLEARLLSNRRIGDGAIEPSSCPSRSTKLSSGCVHLLHGGHSPQRFQDVDIDNGVNAAEFCEACDAVIAFFGKWTVQDYS